MNSRDARSVRGRQATGSPTVGVIGFLLVLLGLAAVLIGMFALNWLAETDFGQLHDAASERGGGSGFAKSYYQWLGYTMLALATALGLLANLPIRSGAGLRVVAAVVALLGAGMTTYAISLSGQEAFGDFFDAAQAGYFVAIAGFIVIAVGAVIRPRRN